MLRSAAKNWESVTVVTDPADYGRVAAELEADRETALRHTLDLARKVFATTSRYDGMIAAELERLSVAGGHAALVAKEALRSAPILPSNVGSRCATVKIRTRPPHFIFPRESPSGGIGSGKTASGKELSYNNFVDLEAARSIAAEFQKPAAVIIKHNNPAAPRNSKRCSMLI